MKDGAVVFGNTSVAPRAGTLIMLRITLVHNHFFFFYHLQSLKEIRFFSLCLKLIYLLNDVFSVGFTLYSTDC